MVVLAASVVTKTGKALVSRQFVDMTRIRIEGLLAAFPKLVNSTKQHTYVETENVRYVYQPMETLYLVLVTNKQSNILEDLETMKLLSRVLNEYEMDEESISENCFEIVFAFDEAISFGHREHINMQQIKTNLAMESHEEKLHKMIIQSKINDTKDIMKKKAMEIDKIKLEKKLEAGRSSFSGMSGGSGGNGSGGFGGGGGGMGGGGSRGGMGMGGGGAAPSFGSDMNLGIAPTQSSYTTKKSSGAGKGMKLGKKKTSLLETFKQDAAVPELESPKAAAAPKVPVDPVTIDIEEKVSCTMQSDGTLEGLDIQGNMTLEVHTEESSCIRVLAEMGDNQSKGIQFKTHPNIDKALFNSSNTLGLKDPNRPFPTGSALGVLKWRLSPKDESMMPLQISCWPSVSGSDTYVNIEYEASEAFDLQNLQIVIPIPGNEPPQVNSCDGDYELDHRNQCLVWQNELVDDSNRNGSMEFVLSNVDPEGIYPIEVEFSSPRLFCEIAVAGVVSCKDDQPVRYACRSLLQTENYEVVA